MGTKTGANQAPAWMRIFNPFSLNKEKPPHIRFIIIFIWLLGTINNFLLFDWRKHNKPWGYACFSSGRRPVIDTCGDRQMYWRGYNFYLICWNSITLLSLLRSS
jgi:hypothetical protein